MKKKKVELEVGQIWVEVFEQASGSRCYGVVILIKGKFFRQLDREFFPKANYNYLPLPEAQKKAAEIAVLLGQKVVEVDSISKELTYKTLSGVRFVFETKKAKAKGGNR